MKSLEQRIFELEQKVAALERAAERRPLRETYYPSPVPVVPPAWSVPYSPPCEPQLPTATDIASAPPHPWEAKQ